jgi:tetratricopeptide (TPR) repeat protein
MIGNIFSDKELETLPTQAVSFLLDSQKQLRISTVCDDTVKSWRYYSHHIGRFPLDLRAHAQRLFLIIDNDMSKLLAGAMQDLFIALEDHGFSFKNSMLEHSKQQLIDEDIQHFEAWLSTNTRSSFKPMQGSVLDKGLPGKVEKLVIFEQTQEEQPHYDNVIEEANAYLEYGQVEEAQSLLEETLQENGYDENIALELLNIYQYTRDRVSFETMTQQFINAGAELPEEWRQVQNESQQW